MHTPAVHAVAGEGQQAWPGAPHAAQVPALQNSEFELHGVAPVQHAWLAAPHATHVPLLLHVSPDGHEPHPITPPQPSGTVPQLRTPHPDVAGVQQVSPVQTCPEVHPLLHRPPQPSDAPAHLPPQLAAHAGQLAVVHAPNSVPVPPCRWILTTWP